MSSKSLVKMLDYFESKFLPTFLHHKFPISIRCYYAFSSAMLDFQEGLTSSRRRDCLLPAFEELTDCIYFVNIFRRRDLNIWISYEAVGVLFSTMLAIGTPYAHTVNDCTTYQMHNFIRNANKCIACMLFSYARWAGRESDHDLERVQYIRTFQPRHAPYLLIQPRKIRQSWILRASMLDCPWF